jgi:hypothetical protein
MHHAWARTDASIDQVRSLLSGLLADGYDGCSDGRQGVWRRPCDCGFQRRGQPRSDECLVTCRVETQGTQCLGDERLRGPPSWILQSNRLS